MDFFRKLNSRLFFSLTLVVLVLNVSIDPPDLLANLDSDIELEENIHINEMESISEVVLEKVFDMENAIPETDDEDSETLLKKVELANPTLRVSNIICATFYCIQQNVNSNVPILNGQNAANILSPPPQA